MALTEKNTSRKSGEGTLKTSEPATLPPPGGYVQQAFAADFVPAVRS